jgi:hypothetical protein
MVVTIARLRRSISASGFVLALGLVSVTLARAQQPCSDHKEPPIMLDPLGQHVNRFISVQTANAAPARFIFFPNEWFMGGYELGPMGSRHLLAVAHAPSNPNSPIVVEASGNRTLDEARRLQLVLDLQRLGMQDADHRVVVNLPSGEGLRGEQAELTYQSWLTSGNNDWNHGLYPGFGGAGYFGGYGPGNWGQGFWGMGVGGGYGYGGLLSIPYRN